jgi:acyl-CoA synthetase (AMP-forming)/AMP-acid ligase II
LESEPCRSWFESADVSYAEFDVRIGAWAYELLASDVSEGERLAYLGLNRPELLELFFACSRVRAIFVPLNARMPPRSCECSSTRRSHVCSSRMRSFSTRRTHRSPSGGG